MEEKKNIELNDETLDAVTGGARPYMTDGNSAPDPMGLGIDDDLFRMDDGPIKYCKTCQKNVRSKVSFYGNKFFCPSCTKQI